MKGFTLIELIIVVAVLAIIAAIAVNAYRARTKPVGTVEVQNALGTDAPLQVPLAIKTHIATVSAGWIWRIEDTKTGAVCYTYSGTISCVPAQRWGDQTAVPCIIQYPAEQP